MDRKGPIKDSSLGRIFHCFFSIRLPSDFYLFAIHPFSLVSWFQLYMQDERVVAVNWEESQ